MSHVMTVQQAAKQLSEVLRALSADDEIILTENGKTVAKIVPSFAAPSRRRAGNCKGMLKVIVEDDEHLQDFKDYML